MGLSPSCPLLLVLLSPSPFSPPASPHMASIIWLGTFTLDPSRCLFLWLCSPLYLQKTFSSAIIPRSSHDLLYFLFPFQESTCEKENLQGKTGNRLFLFVFVSALLLGQGRFWLSRLTFKKVLLPAGMRGACRHTWQGPALSRQLLVQGLRSPENYLGPMAATSTGSY